MTPPNNTVAGLAEKLLPCPFCGSANTYIETVAPHTHKVARFMPDYEGGAMATCADCCAAHWRDGKDAEAEVIAAWNRRALASPAPSAPVVDRVKVLEMFLGRIFAAQQLNENREYKGWKISGRGSLNEVVAEAREYLNCPLGAVDLLALTPAAAPRVENHIVDANKMVAPAVEQGDAAIGFFGNVKVGNAPTATWEKYPGLGKWWVQLRIGPNYDTVLARVYADDMDSLRARANAIAMALNEWPKQCATQPGARGVEGMVPAISPNGTDDDMLAYLDKLLTVQGQLMFARENYDEEAAETFGVAILDFMRLYGMRLRAKLAAHAAEVEALKESLDGKRHEANAAWVAAEAAERDASAKQARIDALMLEYCPDEMTPEQVAEWAQHQAVAATEQAGERENGTEV